MTTIKSWPEGERPREKLLNYGADHLTDAELLAILIRCGSKGKTAIDVARDVLSKVTTLSALSQLPLKQFCKLPGLSQTKYAEMQASLEINRRCLEVCLHNPITVMDDPQHIKAYIVSKLRPYRREVFACLFLDVSRRFLSFDIIFQGSLTSAPVHPREIAKLALEKNAAGIILAHNHPDGTAQPSKADHRITDYLAKCLQPLNITIHNHLIVGRDQVTSLMGASNPDIA